MHAIPPRRIRGSSAVFNALALSLLGFGLAGCPAERSKPDASLKGRVVVKGSNTFGEELAPRLIAEYRRDRPNVAVELESKGSGSGFAALLAGECDVASSSRNPTTDEIAHARTRGIELKEYVIGYYGVAVIVNRSNSVHRLTKDQVKDIFTGAVRNWKAVGGSDAAIHVYIRDPVAGTNLGFRELAMDNRPYVQEAKQFTTYAELAKSVAQDLGGVGYASMHLANEAGIKALPIGKTEPNALSVNEGWYPYSRMLRLYTNKAAETPTARDFVLFVQRDPGQRILDELGFVRRFEKKLNSLTPE